MFIPSTTQLQLLTSRPEPRPIYDDAVFAGSSRVSWLRALAASRPDRGVAVRTLRLAGRQFRTRRRGDCPSEVEAWLARRPR